MFVAAKLAHAAASMVAYARLPAEIGWLAVFGAETAVLQGMALQRLRGNFQEISSFNDVSFPRRRVDGHPTGPGRADRMQILLVFFLLVS